MRKIQMNKKDQYKCLVCKESFMHKNCLLDHYIKKHKSFLDKDEDENEK